MDARKDLAHTLNILSMLILTSYFHITRTILNRESTLHFTVTMKDGEATFSLHNWVTGHNLCPRIQGEGVLGKKRTGRDKGEGWKVGQIMRSSFISAPYRANKNILVKNAHTLKH